MKKYPTGEFSAQAEARVKELYEERDWQKARDADTPEAYQAFLKQYPDGKWTEEARIRVENFSLAQAPGSGALASTVTPADSAAASTVPHSNGAPGNSPPVITPPVAKSPVAKSPVATSTVTAVPKPAAKAAADSSGSYAVQLGAFKSGVSAANKRWAHLKKEYPTLLTGLSSKVVPKETASGTLYRLQATGLTESHARAICSSLVAKSQACVVVPPA